MSDEAIDRDPHDKQANGQNQETTQEAFAKIQQQPYAQGTWLESHFAWQIRTFWFALLWACTIFIAGLPLTLILVGFAIWGVGLFMLGIWAIYRITRGWIALRDHHAIAA